MTTTIADQHADIAIEQIRKRGFEPGADAQFTIRGTINWYRGFLGLDHETEEE